MSLRAHSIEVKSVREQMRPAVTMSMSVREQMRHVVTMSMSVREQMTPIVTTNSSPVPSLLPSPNLVKEIS